ncbi:hypothetical protein PIB30_009975 [Stylosanthes scabra]|uniref:Uncharacterized protein n=1 Tax=Stylosanthes scabra TaxID=79078 RepID=A0ABU6U464_9FABA|nr:hypothetical protein [Stylosanthes scabra]
MVFLTHPSHRIFTAQDDVSCRRCCCRYVVSPALLFRKRPAPSSPDFIFAPASVLDGGFPVPLQPPSPTAFPVFAARVDGGGGVHGLKLVRMMLMYKLKTQESQPSPYTSEAEHLSS